MLTGTSLVLVTGTITTPAGTRGCLGAASTAPGASSPSPASAPNGSRTTTMRVPSANTASTFTSRTMSATPGSTSSARSTDAPRAAASISRSPSRAASHTVSAMSAVASGTFSCSPRARRARASSAAVKMSSRSRSVGVRRMWARLFPAARTPVPRRADQVAGQGTHPSIHRPPRPRLGRGPTRPDAVAGRSHRAPGHPSGQSFSPTGFNPTGFSPTVSNPTGLSPAVFNPTVSNPTGLSPAARGRDRTLRRRASSRRWPLPPLRRTGCRSPPPHRRRGTCRDRPRRRSVPRCRWPVRA
jgi:hypothetical protein